MAILNTSELRREWAPPCDPPWARVTLHGGAKVTVDPLIVDAVLALSACLEAHGYEATPPDTGAYACRKITGGTGYSLHAYGIAIDINWLSNPYTKGPLITDMPPAMVADIKAIRTRTGRQVWGWGGDYRSVKDAMHFEIVTRQADIASGIDPATVPGGSPPNDKEWDEMATEQQIEDAAQRGAAAAVAQLEERITALEERVGTEAAGTNGRLDALALGAGDATHYQGHEVPRGGLLEGLRQLAEKADGGRTIRTLSEMVWNIFYDSDGKPRSTDAPVAVAAAAPSRRERRRRRTTE